MSNTGASDTAAIPRAGTTTYHNESQKMSVALRFVNQEVVVSIRVPAGHFPLSFLSNFIILLLYLLYYYNYYIIYYHYHHNYHYYNHHHYNNN